MIMRFSVHTCSDQKNKTRKSPDPTKDFIRDIGFTSLLFLDTDPATVCAHHTIYPGPHKHTFSQHRPHTLERPPF